MFPPNAARPLSGQAGRRGGNVVAHGVGSGNWGPGLASADKEVSAVARGHRRGIILLVRISDLGSASMIQMVVSREQIAAFCRRHRIRRLAVFGSAVRNDFGPDSDVDVLVEFEVEARVDI